MQAHTHACASTHAHTFMHTALQCYIIFTLPLFFILVTLHVLINIACYQAFFTNPKNQGTMLLFVRSLKYYKI